jgi:hypothetical protein
MNKDLPKDPAPLFDDDVCITETGADNQSLHVIVENDVNLHELFRKAYYTDTMCGKILSHPEVHPHFQVVDDLDKKSAQM